MSDIGPSIRRFVFRTLLQEYLCGSISLIDLINNKPICITSHFNYTYLCFEYLVQIFLLISSTFTTNYILKKTCFADSITNSIYFNSFWRKMLRLISRFIMNNFVTIADQPTAPFHYISKHFAAAAAATKTPRNVLHKSWCAFNPPCILQFENKYYSRKVVFTVKTVQYLRTVGAKANDNSSWLSSLFSTVVRCTCSNLKMPFI